MFVSINVVISRYSTEVIVEEYANVIVISLVVPDDIVKTKEIQSVIEIWLNDAENVEEENVTEDPVAIDKLSFVNKTPLVINFI